MPLERLPSETSPIPGGRPNARKPPQRPARRQLRRFSALADGVLAALLILGMAVSWLVIAQRLHPSQSSAPALLQAYHGHVDGPAVWSSDSAYVSFLAESTSSAETVFVWERATGHLTGHVLHTLLVNSERVAVFAPDGQHIAFAELDQNEKEAVQVWDTLSWQHILTAYSFATYPVVLWTADSSSIVIPNDRGAVQAWSIATGRQLADCRVPPIAYLSSNALLSPDGQRVLYGYGQQHMYLLNLKTCKLLTFPSSDANSTFWSPQGTRFATISLTDASTVQVWDAMTGQNLENFHLGASVSTINWTPDGSRIVIADEKGVAVVDVATQRIVLNVTPAGTQLPPVWALSPDGTRLATQVGANVVQLWDAVTGHKLNAYQGQGKRVTVLAWSPDSRSLAAGSGDGTGQVWSGNREPAILHSGSSSILNMTWSPDGKCIAVGGLDGRMWVWQVN